MKNILYEENDKIKTLKTEEFSYVFDKESGTSFSWGTTQNETADFDVFSPEIIVIKIDDSFKFNNYNLKKLLNVNLKVDDDFNERYFLSTISNIELILNKKLLSNDEIKQLINALKEYKINVSIRLNVDEKFSLKEILKIKLMNVDTIIFDACEITDELANTIKTFISNKIFVNCNFYLNSKTIEKFINDLDKLPILLNINVFYKTKLDKKLKEFLEKIKSENKINILVKNDYKNIGRNCDNLIIEYDNGLYSCYYDFITNLIYPDESQEKFGIDINEINSVTDFWNSDKFEKFRKNILKKIKK